jgi:hypothetical protein
VLPDTVRKRIEDEARKRGVDPEKALAEAERLANESNDTEDTGDEATGKSSSKRPTFERLLIGVLPFIKVRELRQHWLGLTERVADDEMMCGDFQAKHGGAGQAPSAPEVE